VRYGLPEKTIKKIQAVFATFPQIEKVMLFGSRAKGNFKNGSDIDLTLHGKDLTLKLLHKIENQLDELLLPYKIDLSIFNQISNPDLIEHILRVGITFFEPESHSTAAKKDWVVKDIEED